MRNYRRYRRKTRRGTKNTPSPARQWRLKAVSDPRSGLIKRPGEPCVAAITVWSPWVRSVMLEPRADWLSAPLHILRFRPLFPRYAVCFRNTCDSDSLPLLCYVRILCTLPAVRASVCQRKGSRREGGALGPWPPLMIKRGPTYLLPPPPFWLPYDIFPFVIQ